MKKIKIIMIGILILIAIIGMNKSKNKKEEIINEPQTQIVLYFINPQNEALTKEYRYVSIARIHENLAETIIEELLKGPTSEELKQIIPSNTKLKTIKIENDKIIIDLSKEMIEKNEEELEHLQKTYSIVNSLTEINEINEVEILVDGKEYETRKRL